MIKNVGLRRFNVSTKYLKNFYDFRSDTGIHEYKVLMNSVTRPNEEMRRVMTEASVGDDVYGVNCLNYHKIIRQEDPSVNQLEAYVSNICERESSLFCVSGTMANQLAILAQLKTPPYSILCDSRSHIYNYEGGATSFHTGATVIPIKPEKLSHLTARDIERTLITTEDVHCAPTQLVCLEIPLDGELMPINDLREISDLLAQNKIAIHLDGARIWNACTATSIPLREYCRLADTISMCLSKGLGAPIGSMLVGNHQTIRKARHLRKLFGGGWRQAGMLAAAGLYGIQENWRKLEKDHHRAKLLAKKLTDLGFSLTKRVETNMIWVDFDSHEKIKNISACSMRELFREQGVEMSIENKEEVRIVLHHEIDDHGIEIFLKTLENILII